MIMVESGEG